jgi:hypothetical protein
LMLVCEEAAAERQWRKGAALASVPI